MVLFSNVRRMFVTGLIVIGLSMSATSHATSYTSLVVFGDSLSDSGNIFDVYGQAGVPSPPYAEGRFTSNFTNGASGLVWVEHLAGLMGLPLDNSQAGGTNYAFGGARAVGSNIFTPSLPDQLSFYLSDSGGSADPSSLYVVFGGGNDVRDNDAANSAASIAQIITDLAGLGATDFLVPSLPDIGLTPEALAGEAPGGSSAVISAASAQHNANLAAEIASLEATLGVNIISFDLAGLFSDVIDNPASYDISNIDEACAGINLNIACTDPDSYLFFDGIHPTAAVHQIMGGLAFAEVMPVPVPAALPLFLSALGLLGLRRRRAA